MTTLLAPVSAGELIDKITILEIKTERIRDPEKRRLAGAELQVLTEVVRANLAQTDEVLRERAALKSINEALWDIEEDIRAKERAQSFDAAFVALARAVYQTNDRRSEVKRRLNLLLGSPIMEVKDYATGTGG